MLPPAHTYFFARLNFDMHSFCLCVHLFLQLQCICKFAAVRRSIFDALCLSSRSAAVCSSLINSSMCFSGCLQIIFPIFPFLSYLYLYSMFIFYVSRRIAFVYVFSLLFIYHTQINLNKFLFSVPSFTQFLICFTNLINRQINKKVK